MKQVICCMVLKFHKKARFIKIGIQNQINLLKFIKLVNLKIQA